MNAFKTNRTFLMNKNTLIFILLILLLFGLALFSLSWGRFAIPIENVLQSLTGNNTSDIQNNIIFNLRLPRILAAILVGAALAVAGATFQGIFRNLLVSPDLLGVSSGACIGAAIAILLGFGLFAIQGFAFVGGLIAVLMTMSLPKLVRRDSTIILVLFGIIISGFMMACLGLIKYLADPETQLADIVYWQMGSLTKVDYKNPSLLSPIILFTTGCFFIYSQSKPDYKNHRLCVIQDLIRSVHLDARPNHAQNVI